MRSTDQFHASNFSFEENRPRAWGIWYTIGNDCDWAWDSHDAMTEKQACEVVQEIERWIPQLNSEQDITAEMFESIRRAVDNQIREEGGR